MRTRPCAPRRRPPGPAVRCSRTTAGFSRGSTGRLAPRAVADGVHVGALLGHHPTLLRSAATIAGRASKRSRPRVPAMAGGHDVDHSVMGEVRQVVTLPDLSIMDRSGRHHGAWPVPGAGPLRSATSDRRGPAGSRVGVVAEKRPYVHAVGHCSRCKTEVEPRLSLQWFATPDRWPARPATPCATAGCASNRPSWRSATSRGSTTCTTGASRASCGGATGFPSGTARTARRSARARTTSRPTRRGLAAG